MLAEHILPIRSTLLSLAQTLACCSMLNPEWQIPVLVCRSGCFFHLVNVSYKIFSYITFSTKYQIALRYKYKCGDKNSNNEILILSLLSKKIQRCCIDLFCRLWYNIIGTSVPVEHHTRWRLLPLIGNADSFCLPERGGDADVRYLGIAVSVRRTYNFDINIHRQS